MTLHPQSPWTICRNTTPIDTLSWKYDALSGGFVSGSQFENPQNPLWADSWDSSLQSSNQISLKTEDFFPKSIACGLGFRYPPASQLTMRMITAVAGQTNRQRLSLSPQHGCRSQSSHVDLTCQQGRFHFVQKCNVNMRCNRCFIGNGFSIVVNLHQITAYI